MAWFSSTTRRPDDTPWLRALRRLCLLAASCAALIAMSPTRAHAQMEQPTLSEFDEKAANAWESAERAFRSGDYIEAIRRYNLLRTKFPYSGLSTLADLRIADAYFTQEKYATAIEQYRAFIKLHPQNDQVTYAAWRVALSFAEQMPKDFWMLPPGYQRDLRSAENAVDELRYFLRRYPESKWDEKATRRLLLARRRLADHELYVAKFYLKRDNPRAAAMRLSYMLKNYPGLGLDPDALFLLARAYVELGDVRKARVALNDLIQVHPDHPLSADARAYMTRHNLKPAE